MCCAFLRRLHRGLDECMCGKHKCGRVDSIAQWLTGQSIANALAVDQYTDTDQGNEDLTTERMETVHAKFTGIPIPTTKNKFIGFYTIISKPSYHS